MLSSAQPECFAPTILQFMKLILGKEFLTNKERAETFIAQIRIAIIPRGGKHDRRKHKQG